MGTQEKKNVHWPLIEDLHVFLTIARCTTFARAAAELGLSPSYISKRIGILEKRLETRLFFRNNRTMRLTAEGERALVGAMNVIASMDAFVSDLAAWRESVTGVVNVSCSFGFGLTHISDAISELASLYPELQIKLMLSDQEVDLVEEGIDIEIRIGDDIKDLYIAKLLFENRRILCASADYLKSAGVPETLNDLKMHRCLIIQERNTPFALWSLTDGTDITQVHVNNQLSSNSGGVVLNWALKGHGIALRSMWDVQKHLDSGELVHILPDWYQNANIWAVYATRPSGSARLKVCIDFLVNYFQVNPPRHL
ncbi:LysR family transcriptional regulator [[Pantoea] beijingensis]|uniref:LysR family transcriptional regulator n=1 Tax=[Pantoea] beijingensis TaxID=1324864 RepID=A0A443I9L6_9GAMM|nr:MULTISPECIES: LysR substrate-binding domain-containing protein [Erwiniaceae]RWR00596.1 LysR family transcriptional regulator [[Pantoea] beijingensis]